MMRRKFDETLGERMAAAWFPTDDEVAEAILSVPPHFGLTYVNSQSNTGTCTLTQPAATGVTWNLTALSISMSGPTLGPNSKVTIYDGAVGGTVLHAEYLAGPGAGSVGFTKKIDIPVDAVGRPSLQAVTGNAMTIQVTGTGQNNVSINARFTDGLP